MVMLPPRNDWLENTIEETIDPDLPICDPHHHLWERPGNIYMLDDLQRDLTAGHNIVSTVFLECSSMYREDGPEHLKPLGETEFTAAVAEEAASRSDVTANVNAAIQSHADLTLGAAVQEVLEAHIELGKGRFRGIRHGTSHDPSPIIPAYRDRGGGVMMTPEFREGFAVLQKMELIFDAWMYHPQLPELVDLARLFPDTRIVLDHIGAPLGIGPYEGKRAEVMEVWKQSIAEVAQNENVFVKVGGCGMPNYGNDWHERETPIGSVELAEATAPYYLYVIEQFGVDRCMFESNFPVDKVSYSYNVMWNSFKRIVADFSDSEKAALFHDTATRAYRI